MAPRNDMIGNIETHDVRAVDGKRHGQTKGKTKAQRSLLSDPVHSRTNAADRASDTYEFRIVSQGFGGAGTTEDLYELAFPFAVATARFSIQNIPEADSIHICAFDKNDVQVRVVLSLQNGGDPMSCNALSGLSVVIAEPVARIELRHESDNPSGQTIWISSVSTGGDVMPVEGQDEGYEPASANNLSQTCASAHYAPHPRSEPDHMAPAIAHAEITNEFAEIDQVLERVVPCFTPGTLIATPMGERNVEDLDVGDRVITRDNGIQQIRWVGHRELSTHELQAAPHLQPVRISKGALGNGLPEQNMLLSPNHRVLLASEKAEQVFDDSEVLVSACHLIGMSGVERRSVSRISYIHFMFDQHEVVLSDGIWTESFQPMDRTLSSMEKAQRDEIFELFPDLRSAEGMENYPSARRTLRGEEARLLLH